ncbi:hypothetical protein [Oribacterium sinus]|uniref:hypothetical protein n=1 Tax=Oribacterium sinus TaxID=237576 RepID=UPI0028E80121|nr:hypothetical protein [Oribacterium sinus]
MSHAVRIDYQGISIQCQSICEMASSHLCKLDKMLDEIENSSKRLLNSQTEALRKEIIKTKQKLQAKIDSVIQQARRNASRGTVVVDSDFMGKHANAYGVIDEAKELKKMVARLSDTKIVEFESLLNQLLGNKLESQNERLKDLASGKLSINIEVQRKIEEIEDEIVKQYVYLAWVDHPDESFDRLYTIAMNVKDLADRKQYEITEKAKIEEIKIELREEKIDETTIDKITSVSNGTAKERIQRVREQANAKIVDEKVRKESVKIIVKSIKNRGFVVDAKSINIDRANNQVIIVAMKPSGAKAEFKVFLDGKFEYCFNGYEGQACQKDIQPFMQDLEEVYGIKVMNQTELWGGNPDKNSTIKYQTVNHNSIGG